MTSIYCCLQQGSFFSPLAPFSFFFFFFLFFFNVKFTQQYPEYQCPDLRGIKTVVSSCDCFGQIKQLLQIRSESRDVMRDGIVHRESVVFITQPTCLEINTNAKRETQLSTVVHTFPLKTLSDIFLGCYRKKNALKRNNNEKTKIQIASLFSFFFLLFFFSSMNAPSLAAYVEKPPKCIIRHFQLGSFTALAIGPNVTIFF